MFFWVVDSTKYWTMLLFALSFQVYINPQPDKECSNDNEETSPMPSLEEVCMS